VNIPGLPAEEIRGVCVVRQGMSRIEERYERRKDPRGNVYYWLSGETPVENGNENTDGMALKQKKITITPIHYDLTCDRELKRLRAHLPLLWNDKNRAEGNSQYGGKNKATPDRVAFVNGTKERPKG
jgi:hypothetical protein